MRAASPRPLGAAPRALALLRATIATGPMAGFLLGLTRPLPPPHAPLGLDLGAFVVSFVNPKLFPPASDDGVTFGRGCPVQGRFARERGRSLAGLACACRASAARRANGSG